MRDIVVTLIIFGLLPVVLMRPHVGVLLWSWLGYMNPHRLTYGFAYNFPFAYITFAATAVALLFSKEPKSIPWTRTTIVLLVFIVWMSITTYFALIPEGAIIGWEKAIKIQVVVFITMMLFNNKERLVQLVWVIAFSIGFYGIKGGVFTALTGGQYRVWGPMGSEIEGNNEIALALIIILPLMRFIQMQLTNKYAKYALTVAMLLCILSILGSYSRGALLAGAGMGLFLWWKSRKRIMLGVLILVLVPVSVAFMPSQWFERMETIKTYDQDASALGRFNAWKFAYNLALDRPIVGGGFRTFDEDLFKIYAPEPDNFHDAHSIYFEVLAEQGFVGLALFIMLGVFAFKDAALVLSRTKDIQNLSWAHDLASMVQVSLIGYAIGGAFLGLAYYDLPYHLIAILVLLRKVSENQSEQYDNLSATPSSYQSSANIR
jgi:probable O-glycosylation ligase (exosortase A-associated)